MAGYHLDRTMADFYRFKTSLHQSLSHIPAPLYQNYAPQNLLFTVQYSNYLESAVLHAVIYPMSQSGILYVKVQSHFCRKWNPPMSPSRVLYVVIRQATVQNPLCHCLKSFISQSESQNHLCHSQETSMSHSNIPLAKSGILQNLVHIDL